MKTKTIHILSSDFDAFGVRRKAVCGVYNPELLADVSRLDLEKKGVVKFMVSDDDVPGEVLEGYRICERCLNSFKVQERNQRRREEEKKR